MSNFITKIEVVKEAFTGEETINKGYISDSLISLAEESHIRPILGDDFYDRLNQTSPSIAFDAYETALKGHLKTALAWYIKYEVLPQLTIKVNNTGVNIENSHQTTMGGVQERREVQAQILRKANLFGDIAKRYIQENKDNLTYYESNAGLTPSKRSNGGLIFPS